MVVVMTNYTSWMHSNPWIEEELELGHVEQARGQLRDELGHAAAVEAARRIAARLAGGGYT